ncbi:unnamed protein product [Arctogadus glacialis]
MSSQGTPAHLGVNQGPLGTPAHLVVHQGPLGTPAHLGGDQGPLGTPAPLGGNQGPSEQSRGPEGPQRVLRMVLERCSFPWFF